MSFVLPPRWVAVLLAVALGPPRALAQDVPRAGESPRVVEATQVVGAPRAVEIPRAVESPRAAEAAPAVEAQQAEEAAPAVESQRAEEAAPAAGAPRAMEVPRAVDASPVVDPQRVLDAPRLEVAPEGSVTREARPDFSGAQAALSVFPGLLFHGLGSWVGGDSHTARRLFALEGTGLGLIALGGVPIVFTGASRRTIGPLYAVTLAGFSVFGISALANLYAAAAPTFDPGVVPPSLPPLELSLGYQYVSDPKFDYRHFLTLGALARLDAVKLEVTARVAPDEGNTQLRFGGAYRLLGAPEGALRGTDGSSLDAELYGLFHRYPTEGFSVAGAEAGLRGRYAMARVSPRLAGSFAEASIGASFHGYRFSGPVSDGNLYDQLLFTFGYGVWLGRGGPLRGEALLYYDHRKDGYVGGMRTLGGGVVGAFGLRGKLLLTRDWGVAAEVQAGGALVGRLSLLYTLGGDE